MQSGSENPHGQSGLKGYNFFLILSELQGYPDNCVFGLVELYYTYILNSHVLATSDSYHLIQDENVIPMKF